MKILKIFNLLPIVMLMVSFSSCLKERIGNIDTGNGNTTNLVEFANTGNNVSKPASKYPGFYYDLGVIPIGGSGSVPVNVSYSGVDNAPTDITVNLALDPDALALYNTQNGTSLVIPATALYTLPTSVVIKKGTKTASVKIPINVSTAFNFGVNYAIPLKITSTSPTEIISGNFGSAMYTFGVRNKYDGIYSFKGYILRAGDNTLSGNFTGYERDLVTSGANSVTFSQLWANGNGVAGIDGLTITVDPATNKVTMSSTTNSALKNMPNYDNRYDPATKTFYISFYWGSGPTNRAATDTLTYISARP